MRREMLCGEPVLLGRTREGGLFALRDICPHRAAPLSAGRIREGTVECPYHGWRFKPDGQCAHIPSLLQDQDMDVGRIRVQSYPAREQDGLIWVYFPADAKFDAAPAREPPRIPIGAAAGNAIPKSDYLHLRGVLFTLPVPTDAELKTLVQFVLSQK